MVKNIVLAFIEVYPAGFKSNRRTIIIRAAVERNSGNNGHAIGSKSHLGNRDAGHFRRHQVFYHQLEHTGSDVATIVFSAVHHGMRSQRQATLHNAEACQRISIPNVVVIKCGKRTGHSIYSNLLQIVRIESSNHRLHIVDPGTGIFHKNIRQINRCTAVKRIGTHRQVGRTSQYRFYIVHHFNKLGMGQNDIGTPVDDRPVAQYFISAVAHVDPFIRISPANIATFCLLEDGRRSFQSGLVDPFRTWVHISATEIRRREAVITFREIDISQGRADETNRLGAGCFVAAGVGRGPGTADNFSKAGGTSLLCYNVFVDARKVITIRYHRECLRERGQSV